MAESKTTSEVLKGIKDVFQSYLIFSEENSEQDPGFVIRQLSKVFDSANSDDFKGESEEGILLAKVQKVYGAYKMLLKWDTEAPQILIENLRKILFPKLPELNSNELVVPAPSALNNSVNSDPPAIEFPGFSSDQDQNRGLPENSEFQEIENEPLILEPPSPSFSEEYPLPVLEKFEPVKEHQVEKGKVKHLHSKKQFIVFCKKCKKPFNRISNKIVHELSCSKQLNFGRGLVKLKFLVSPKSKSNVNAETKVKTNFTRPSASSSKTAPNKNQQQKNPVVPSAAATSTGFVPNPELIKDIIKEATKNTLESSGWNMQNPDNIERKSKALDCHLCNNGKKYYASDILANHIRIHTKERPLSCLHPFCTLTCGDSLNYTKHVNLHHGENGALISIHKGTSTSLGNLKKSKSKAPREQEKLNLSLKGKGDFGKSLKLVEKDTIIYKPDDDEEGEEMSGDENDADPDYRPSRSRRGQRKRNGSFPCQFCGRFFGRRGTCAEHVKLVHTREGLFFCSICGHAALTQYKLNLHVAGHNGMDCSFQCHHCDRRFKTQVGRQIHEASFCLEKTQN